MQLDPTVESCSAGFREVKDAAKDRNLKFSERIFNVCEVIRVHKSAAIDLLEGVKQQSIIYAPLQTNKV